MSETKIDIEIDGRGYDTYEHVREDIKKICEDHEDRRDLHITVKNLRPDYSGFAESKERNAE